MSVFHGEGGKWIRANDPKKITPKNWHQNLKTSSLWKLFGEFYWVKRIKKKRFRGEKVQKPFQTLKTVWYSQHGLSNVSQSINYLKINVEAKTFVVPLRTTFTGLFTKYLCEVRQYLPKISKNAVYHFQT